MHTQQMERVKALISHLAKITSSLDQIKDVEQDILDNADKDWQYSKEGQKQAKIIGQLEEAIENISDGLESLEDIKI